MNFIAEDLCPFDWDNYLGHAAGNFDCKSRYTIITFYHQLEIFINPFFDCLA